VTAIAAAAVATVPTTRPGRNPQRRAALASTPTASPAPMPPIAPMAAWRGSRTFFGTDDETPRRSPSASTVIAGSVLAGRPRTAMSR
jgi:hypothetical protein